MCDRTLKADFARRVCDVTPADLRATVCCLYMSSSRDRDFVNQCASVLSPQERDTAKSLPNHDDKVGFTIRRAFRRYCGVRALESDEPLSNVLFTESDTGRPYLLSHPAISFSFSACALGCVAAWSRHIKLGIDIEDPDRSIEAIDVAEKFFTDSEAAAVRNAPAADRDLIFFRLWTLKEAALKSVGQGLPLGLDAFAFGLTPDLHIARAPVEYGGQKMFKGHLINTTNGCASLVMH